jgi:hypothetical protein
MDIVDRVTGARTAGADGSREERPMHRVYVAWDAEDARRFLKVLEGHGIRGRVIEDREFPTRGEYHDTEGAPEVWISDATGLSKALELASVHEALPRGAKPKAPEIPADEDS